MVTPESIAAMAVALHRSHTRAPVLDVLELAFKGQPVDLLRFDDALTHPRSAFGQLIAGAFDRGMSPEEWRDWTSPAAEQKLRDVLLRIWADDVLPRFRARFAAG